MPPSAALLDHLASNVTTCCAIWKMTPTQPITFRDVSWMNAVKCLIADPAHTRNVGGGAWDAGCFSVESFAGDGYIQFTGLNAAQTRMIGLSVDDPNANFTSIDYAWHVESTGFASVYENGNNTIGGFGYTSSTVFKIERVGTTVRYYEGGTLRYTSLVASTGILHADTSIFTASSTVPAVTMSDSDTIAAYAAHTRNLVFDGVTYIAAPVEPTRFSQTLGVQQANHVELFGVFDDIVSEEDVQAGKWKNARVQFEYVNYLDLTMGSIGKMKGQAGKISINNGSYTVEVRSLTDLLQQEIGSLTSPLDRNRTPEDLGVSMIPFTHARSVTAVGADVRRDFTVGGSAQVDDYFKYGRAEFTSGANNGQLMEIKSNTGNVIELQLPILSTIVIGDTVSLIAGYDSTRTQARDKFAAMENFRGEPDLPGLKAVIKYPE